MNLTIVSTDDGVGWRCEFHDFWPGWGGRARRAYVIIGAKWRLQHSRVRKNMAPDNRVEIGWPSQREVSEESVGSVCFGEEIVRTVLDLP